MKILKTTSNLLLLGLLIQVTALEAEEIEKIKIKANSPFYLSYENKSLDRSTEKESIVMLVKDGVTGKAAAISLEETQNRSGQFAGNNIINWPQTEEVHLELYLPPKTLMDKPDVIQHSLRLVQDGQLLRKPFFIRKDNNRFYIQVFDSKAQALAAYSEYRKAGTNNKELVDQAALEAQRKAQLEAEKARLAAIAAQQEEDRARLAEQERLKKEELIKKAKELAAAEKRKRKMQANALANEGLELYRKQEFKSALEKFEKATELDPENKIFYFQYGVSLYRLEEYNKALVILQASEGLDSRSNERVYYMALTHMKLKEYDASYQKFSQVKSSGDKKLAPASAFFMGVMDFQEEKYEGARKSFEYVLDHSSDPQLDNQAESYIEQIANIMAFEEARKKKFLYTASLGLSYDSNILTISNSQIDSGVATDLAGFRWSYGGSIEYRPIYGPTHEFSTRLSASDIYSTDGGFQANANFQSTDPLSMAIQLPYKYKGKAFNKAYQLSVTPGYESILMNIDGTGGRETILNSGVLKVDQTFVMNNDWFSTYSLELRSDTSGITSGDDDQSATKVSIFSTNTFFQNARKTEAWVADVGLSQNNAKGVNQKYNRIDIAGTYLRPWKWDTSLTARLGFYSANYFAHTSGRSDNNMSLSTSLRKPMSSKMSAYFGFSYTLNKSTNTSTDYNKYVLNSGLTWDGLF